MNRMNRKNKAPAIALILVLPGLLLALCPLMHCSLLLEKLQSDSILSTYPADRNSVLAADEIICVQFAAGVDRASAELIVQLSGLQGKVDGSYRWQEEHLEFHPLQPLTPGRRYSLEINGELHFCDGRVCRVQRSIPFFYLQQPDPEEESLHYLPQSGSTLGRQSEVVLNFRSAVDKTSLIQDLRISPFSDYLFQWDDTATELTVTPLRGWEDRSVCRFDFDTLPYPPAEYHIDHQSPHGLTVELSPVELNWEDNFPPAACELAGLLSGCSVQLRCSRPVDPTEFASSVRFQPVCSGSFFWKDDRTAVFIPDKPFPPAATYHCLIDAEISSADSFTTAGALPRIVNLEGEAADGIPGDIEAAMSTILDITPSGPENTYSFLFEYAQAVSDSAARAGLQSGAHLRTIFPPDLPPPEIVSFLWPDDMHLLLQVQGLGTQADGRTAYYSFQLPETDAEPAVLELRVSP